MRAMLHICWRRLRAATCWGLRASCARTAAMFPAGSNSHAEWSRACVRRCRRRRLATTARVQDLGGAGRRGRRRRHRSHKRGNEVTANLIGMPSAASPQAEATEAWSRRVRRMGGLNQVAYAFVLFWLIRGSFGEPARLVVLVSALTVSGAAVAYGIRASAGKTPRPTSSEGRRLERAITAATVIQLTA